MGVMVVSRVCDDCSLSVEEEKDTFFGCGGWKVEEKDTFFGCGGWIDCPALRYEIDGESIFLCDGCCCECLWCCRERGVP